MIPVIRIYLQKQTLGDVKNISCNRNEPKQCASMENYRGVKLSEATARLQQNHEDQ